MPAPLASRKVSATAHESSRFVEIIVETRTGAWGLGQLLFRPSHPELPFGFVVRDALPGVEIGKPSVDLCEKHQSFDSVLECGVLRQILQARRMRSRTVSSDIV